MSEIDENARRDAFLRQYVGFCASCLFGAIANWSVSIALIKYLGVPTLLAAFIGIVAGTVFNFVLCRYFVFRFAPSAGRDEAAATLRQTRQPGDGFP